MLLHRIFRSPQEKHVLTLIKNVRAFGITIRTSAKALPPRPKINEADISEKFIKGSGPGGQKIVLTLFPCVSNRYWFFANFHWSSE